MNRRTFISQSSVAGMSLLLRQFVGYEVLTHASTLLAANGKDSELNHQSLTALLNKLKESDALILKASDKLAKSYQISFNKRIETPCAIRILPKTQNGLMDAYEWVRSFKLNFAVRCGGHSYEGFSQNSMVVIDLRFLNSAQLDATNNVLTTESGARLGHLYETVSALGHVIPAGSCPTVGVSGHVQGGGFGLLSRTFGLACDHLISAEMIDHQGRRVIASQSENKDLFWALRGGGGGSFGIVTKYQFKTEYQKNVSIFGLVWQLPAQNALSVFQVWQNWMIAAPKEVTSIFRVTKVKDGIIGVNIAGQSIFPESWLKSQLASLIELKPNRITIKNLPFMQAVKHFGGSAKVYPSVFMKGKSDYLYKTLSDEGFNQVTKGLLKLSPGALGMIFDSYGGKISEVNSQETAFFHRKALFGIQYYSQWNKSQETVSKLQQMKEFHQSLRPFMSGYAYVNYCDLDISNWPRAYWGNNLEKLIKIKKQWDPENIFKHKQSIPTRLKQ